MGSRGRPRKTLDESLKHVIIELYKEGKTDAQVARIIGISRQTLHNLKASDQEFLDSLKDSKGLADELVEASLFQRAIGYTHPEEKIFCAFGQVTRVKTTKHYPPDPTAQIFWLKNRRPDRWRDVAVIQKEEAEKKLKSEKKSFEQFCIDAGYPKPFQKQLEMMAFGIADDEPRLLLGARGYGKSDYVTIMGVAYDVYLNGIETSNLIISKSKTRNTSMIEEIANALIANGIELEKQNSSCIRVKGLIGKEHSVEVLTIKSSFRGRHPKRILMDDPVTEEDTSEAMRLLVKKKYDEAYKLCKNIVIIGQPAHQFDLYAELRPQLNKMEIPWGSIPELDADLEAMKLAGIDERSIQMSYHLTIPKDGAMPFENIKYIDQMPKTDTVAWIDPSFKGGDYTALTICTGYFDGIAAVGFTYKKAWNHCIDEMALELKKYGVKKLAIECNSLGDMPVVALREVLPGIGIVGQESHSNKHAKIMAAGIYAHRIHLSKESHKVYQDQLTRYEYNAKNDDAPDSLASCLQWLGLIRGKI